MSAFSFEFDEAITMVRFANFSNDRENSFEL